MIKKGLLIIALIFNYNALLFGQNSDCPTALFLCNENSFSVLGGGYSQGSIAESPGCWFGHTDNASHWYSFTCTQSGTFAFSCLPNPYADFDFALYNITGSAAGTCNLGNIISCNYSVPAGNGTTGIGCANGAGCNGTVNLIAGQTYALLINRYTVGSTSGFTLSFGGTAQIGIIANFTNTTVCLGQSVQFTNTSSTGTGVTYSWDFDDGGISSLQNPSHLYIAAGTYNVQLITSNGSCSDTIIHQVIITPGPVITVNPNPSSICAGQTVALTASGATTYTWAPNYNLTSTTGANVTASPVVSTTYTVTGTTNGCNGTTTTVVSVNALSTVNSFPASSVICEGDSVIITGIGANTYSWAPSIGLNSSTGSSVVAIPTITTTYVLTGTNAAGCDGFDTTIITVNSLPIIAVNPSAPSICGIGNVQLTASGANTYSWNPPTSLNNNSISNPIASPLSTITYVVTGTSIQNCISTAQVVVTVNQLPAVSFNGLTSINCINASVNNLLGNPAGGVFLGQGIVGNSFDPLQAGIGGPYTITYSYTDANGCSNTSTQQTTVIAGANISVSAVSNSICAGSNTIITASGGQTYSWSPSTGLNSTLSASVTAQPTATITYSVTGIDINGCSGTATIDISVNTLPNVIATGINICSGQSGIISATGALTYQWGPNSALSAINISNPVASPVVTSTYTVLGTDFNGCVNSATAVVTVFSLPVVTINPATSLFCPGASLMLSAGGASSYIWSPSQGLNTVNNAIVTASPATTTIYTVTGTDANGCFATATATLTLDPIPIASFTLTPEEGCEPLLVSFQNTSNNGINAIWHFGDGTNGAGNSTQHVYNAGVFDVIMIAYNTSGCSDTLIQSSAVTVLPSPTAFFNMDPPAPGNLPYTDNLFNFINSSANATNYIWNFGDNTSDTSFNSTHRFTETGSYYVILTAIGSNGCTDTAQSSLIVIEGEPKPWIPSAFTPNNDGTNDYFKIYGIAIATIDFRVYDRWGEMVFQTNDATLGWDGNFHNHFSSTDVYVYVAKIKMLSGKKYILKGDVTLFR